MKIHVEGTIDHPSMWTEAFPVAGEALEMLRADAERQGPRRKPAGPATAGSAE